MHRATTGRTFCGCVAQLESLLHLQVRQTFDFQDAARENVLLALFGHRQQTGLDGVQRDSVHEVTQGNARLHFALKPHQHALRHVQRHHARSSTKSDQARTGGETDADGEPGVAVATGADGVGQQHAVQPAVDDAVAGAQRDTTTGAHEVGQLVVHLHVHGLGVSSGVAERLHHQVSTEAQAGQVFQFITGHGAGGVLGPHRRHLGFAVGTGAHALAFWQAHSTAHHLLRECETTAVVGRALRQAEQGGRWQAQRKTRLGGQAPANDQGNTATGAHFVEQHVTLQRELGNHLAVLQRLAFVRTQLNHVTHGHLAHVQLDRQCARVFHGVVEDRGDLAAQTHTTKTLVGHKRNVFASEPQHRVGGGLAAGAGTDHIAHIGHQVALGTQVFEELNRAAFAVFFRHDARAGILVHGQRVQRDVGAAPGVGRGRQVVGVDFTGHFEDADGDALRHFGAAGKPLTFGPALQHGLGVFVALFGLFLHVVELVEHQQCVLQARSGDFGHTRAGVVQQVNQGADVVATQHGAKQLGGFFARQQRALFGAVGHSGQVAGLDLGRIVHTGGHAVGDEVQQVGFFTGGRCLQQFDQFTSLLGRQRQRGDTEHRAFGNMGGIGLQHGFLLGFNNRGGKRRSVVVRLIWRL